MLVYNNSLNTLETGILCELTRRQPPPPPPFFHPLLGPVMPRRNKPFSWYVLFSQIRPRDVLQGICLLFCH